MQLPLLLFFLVCLGPGYYRGKPNSRSGVVGFNLTVALAHRHGPVIHLKGFESDQVIFARKVVKCCFIALLMGFGLLLDRAPAVQAGPVPFEQLLPFVEIKIPGWEASDKPIGSIMKEEGVSTSQVRASFRSGNKTLEIMIIDFPGNGAFFPETGKMEKESSEGYVRHITMQGFAAQETYTQDRHGELHIYVQYRFMVIIEGSNLDNTEVLKKAAKKMDLKKLAALAKK